MRVAVDEARRDEGAVGIQLGLPRGLPSRAGARPSDTRLSKAQRSG